MDDKKQEIGQYLVLDPEICHGKLTFRNTRIPVDVVFSYLGKGYSIDQLVRSWPQLTREAVEEAVHLASDSLQMRFGASAM